MIYHKALEILSRKGVSITATSPRMIVFEVRQLSGNITEVYYRLNKSSVWEWSCNATVTEIRQGKTRSWGCVMSKPAEKPKCSHCVAALLFYKKQEENDGIN